MMDKILDTILTPVGNLDIPERLGKDLGVQADIEWDTGVLRGRVVEQGQVVALAVLLLDLAWGALLDYHSFFYHADFVRQVVCLV